MVSEAIIDPVKKNPPAFKINSLKPTVVDDVCIETQDDPAEEEFDLDELWPANAEVSLSKKATKSPAVNTDIEYAPQKPVKKGEKSLCVARIVWSSGHSDSISTAQSAANSVSSNYKRLSGGLFNIKPKVVSVQVPWKNSYKYVKDAEKRVKGQFKSDWYAICTGGASGVSHAGGNTAILRGAGAITHEVGHLIGLGHANRYELDPKFKGKPGTTGTDGLELDLKYFKMNGSADGSSVMSTFASAQLTAPQLYSLGWLNKDQVALHRFDSPAKQYNLEIISGGNTPGYLKAVLIPGPEGEGRDLFLSVVRVKAKGKDNATKPALTLHLGNPGSNRIVTFGPKPLSFRGLTFEAKQSQGTYFTVEVRPFVPKKK